MLGATKGRKRGIPCGNAAPYSSKCVDQSKDALVMLAEKVVPAASARVAATKAFATTAEALATTTKAFLRMASAKGMEAST